MKFYAVRRGRKVGVYTSWAACNAQVNGYPGAQYKSFSTRGEAEAYIASPDNSQLQSAPQYADSDFSVLSHSPVHIWVDGACVQKPDGTLQIGWAFLVYKNNEEVYRDKGDDIPLVAHRHRNVAGEIMAALQAVSWCQSKGIKEFTIHYDYQGLKSWVTGEWRVKTSFTQDYANTIRSSGLNIHWAKVKAHSGELRNEIVDKLAREGALKGKSRTTNGCA